MTPVIVSRPADPLTKLEVARRQLVEATRMFFDRRDPISVHTVTCAGAQIVSDLLVAKRGQGFLRSGHVLIKEKRTEALRAFRAPENFFKHADRDSDRTFAFNPAVVEHCLFLGLFEYHLLTGEYLWEHRVFHMWYFIRHPDLLLESEFKTTLAIEVERHGLRSSEHTLFRALLDRTRPSDISFLSSHRGTRVHT